MVNFLYRFLRVSIFMTILSSATTYAVTTYPAFPVPLKNGAGVKVGQVIYAGLGSAGKDWFSIDLSAPEPRWQRLADFPAEPRDQSVAAAVDGKIYIFGGAGEIKRSDNTVDTIMFSDVYCFDPVANNWRKLETRSPLGLLGAVAVSVDGQRVLFFSGVNKAIFDGYFQDLKAAGSDEKRKSEIANEYFGKRPQDYLFSTDVLSYTPAENAWGTLGKVTYPPTAGAAVAVKGNEVTLINGELKPGLRSYKVNRVTIDGNSVASQSGPDLVAPVGQSQQEGLAGAFAGYSNGVLLVAGGANFPGAWNQYRQGQNYAHRGLQKTWHDDIYALIDGKWQTAGHLPGARAYGLSFMVDDGVLLVGGENQQGKAIASVQLLLWEGKSASIVAP
ncbi:N-acetylneuraminate epimerase [Paraburkholderia agricolaris]|uniref:N-acetylneuraminate epimerase n=1 Tax=Paraburkholderia agricolaris TaxID=2152888 RepID=UPI001292028D|nr:N-acetylneuraminate epimerase [Paraburkholderia agricolaris]